MPTTQSADTSCCQSPGLTHTCPSSVSPVRFLMVKVVHPSLSISTRRNTVEQVLRKAHSHSSPLASIHVHIFSSKGKSIHMMSISTALEVLHSGLRDQGYYTSFPACRHFWETPGPRCTREIGLKPRDTITGQNWAVSI